MKIVVLSTCDAADVFLIQTLRSKFDQVKVLRPVWVPRPSGAPRKPIWLRISVAALAARAREAIRNWRTGRVSRHTSRLLFGTDQPPTPSDCEDVVAQDINEQETADRLRALEPDFLLVSGAPILQERIFTISKIATVNVHYGIAPQYRGEDTIFWPLYHGDYENIGVTLHHIDKRIDTGSILAEGYPALERGDTEASLIAKCARLAADLMVEVVEAGHHHPTPGRAQETAGRLYLRRHRKVWREIHYALKRGIGRRSPPTTAVRTVRHFVFPGAAG